jgi:voltage-gated potassium channel
MDLKESLVKLSYRVLASRKYRDKKELAREILEDSNSSKKRLFDLFMMTLVLVTIFILIFEIKNDLHPVIYFIEGVAIFIFILEWLARVWVSSDIHKIVINRYERGERLSKNVSLGSLLLDITREKFKFIFSAMSIIDLLAILPSYRPLRFLRFFLLFRLLKIFRYTQSMNFLLRIFTEKKFEFITLLILFMFLTFFASTIFYIFEGVGANENINSFYDSFYWAVVTITTVGYGDISPQTPQGRFATMLLIVSGLGIIAFTTSIVTTAMTEKLELAKENSLFNQASRFKDFVLICGFGRMGMGFADELKSVNEKLIIIDQDKEAINRAVEKDILALRGDASEIDILRSLNITKNAKYVVAMTDNDALNLSIILSVKSLDQDLDVIARANSFASIKKFKIAGAKRVVFPYHAASVVSVEYMEKPIVYKVMDSITTDMADEIVVYLEDGEKKKVLKRSMFKKHRLKLLGVVKYENNKFIFNPKDKEIEVEELDKLIVFGGKEDITDFVIELADG